MKYTFELLHQGQARLLVSIFIAWKLFLVSLAVLCPGPGYDTSALILLSDNGNRELQFQSFSLSDRFTLNLLRWDALYFVKAAERGYVYEQEWAFSRAYSLVLSAVKDHILRLPEPSLNLYIWTGIAVSNICHLISVLVLYRFVCLVLRPRNDVRIPFIAATLHIFSPAGIILSAAYSESLFSALHFTGMLYYVLARQTSEASSTWGASQDVYMLSSGLFFAVATLVRGNGLLSGLIFLFDVTSIVPRILALQLDANETRRIIVTCVAGLILASGFITPQFLAYQEFCAADSSGLQTRPWCHKWIPSIYSWVQSHYWNVGFLRYWTFPNLPLFLMAAPMLWVSLKSSVVVLPYLLHHPTADILASQLHGPSNTRATKWEIYSFPQLALPQLVLTITATTNFHVQIINRISSGYPVWYLMLATWISNQGVTPSEIKNPKYSEYIIHWMILYAIVQSLLFANFLPPA